MKNKPDGLCVNCGNEDCMIWQCWEMENSKEVHEAVQKAAEQAGVKLRDEPISDCPDIVNCNDYTEAHNG